MHYEGIIFKMRTELAAPVRYFLPVGDEEISVNGLLGRKLIMHFTGRIHCISCGKEIKRSFNQGFCYQCLQTAPEASETVIRPELSKAHLGIARDMEWAREHDLIDHYVYLALASEVKVGVTRNHQIPARWIDQGASQAIVVAKTPNRHIAGIMEVLLKKQFTDKTNWREMLRNKEAQQINLAEEKAKALEMLSSELRKYHFPEDEIITIEYPVMQYPGKIKNLSFDKQSLIEGTLLGIKGQYLLFDEDRVLNIRKHNGYSVEVDL
jgi:hypothetical protein